MASTPDLAEFMALSRPKKPPCQVATAAGALTDAEREQLRAACATDKALINTGAIRAWLRTRGHDVSVSAVTNHRNAICSCDG